MAHEYPRIDPALHQQILDEKILRHPKLFLNATPVGRPRAIITAGQPGAGKGNLVDAAKADLFDNVVTIDPDQLRAKHPQVEELRRQHPYTWSGHTHGDASQWATELREAAMGQRKNITLGNTMPRTDVIQELKAQGSDVEIRAIAIHRLESEVRVDNRFSRDLDSFGHGRHIPEVVRSAVYQRLPGALEDVAQQTGVPIKIYDREGRLHFDSRTPRGKTFSFSGICSCDCCLDFTSLALPFSSPGRALEIARNVGLTLARLIELQHATNAQRNWHRELPDHLQQGTSSHTTHDRVH